MIYTEHKITLDVHQTVAPVAVRVKKGDTGRRLKIHLAERGYPYHISQDCYAVFTAKKPDGKVVFNNCSITDCVIGYDFTAQTVAVAGLVDSEIILYGDDGKQITSASFHIIVEDTIYDTETEIESTDEYNALADLIGRTQKLFSYGPVAPAVVRYAEGALIGVTDASNQALQGLRIFGKSTQNGTPTPDNPVEIVSLAAPVISVTDGTEDNVQAMTITTPGRLSGIPVASGGNYTDSDGQQWICDEIDLGRGVYVQRIGKLDLSTISTWVRGTGNGWANLSAFHSSNAVPKAVPVDGYDTMANIMCNRLIIEKPGRVAGKIVNSVGQGMGTSIYVSVEGIETAEGLIAYLAKNVTIVQYALAVPVETKLTEAEIAAFAALHTNKPNTIIYNDAGAYMAAEYVADTKIYVDRNGGAGSLVTIGTVTLTAAKWVGNDSPYSQVVQVAGATENSQVDLKPSVEQLAIFHDKDLAFVTENEDGVVTVYAIGDKPTNDYTMQVSITEVNV